MTITFVFWALVILIPFIAMMWVRYIAESPLVCSWSESICIGSLFGGLIDLLLGSAFFLAVNITSSQAVPVSSIHLVQSSGGYYITYQVTGWSPFRGYHLQSNQSSLYLTKEEGEAQYNKAIRDNTPGMDQPVILK